MTPLRHDWPSMALRCRDVSILPRLAEHGLTLPWRFVSYCVVVRSLCARLACATKLKIFGLVPTLGWAFVKAVLVPLDLREASEGLEMSATRAPARFRFSRDSLASFVRLGRFPSASTTRCGEPSNRLVFVTLIVP